MGDLAEPLNIPLPAVTKHLKILEEAHAIEGGNQHLAKLEGYVQANLR